MTEARWKEGMLPHVRYDPRYVDDYFPGPDRWPNAQAHVAVPGLLTSGISNPPILVSATLALGRRQPSEELREEFWRRCYPALRDWIDYLRTSRRLASGPLVAVVHPWESGWDNSPRWDRLASARLRPSRPYTRLDAIEVRAADRPTDRDYDAYLALVELLDGVDYDVEAYRERSPFCVHDVLFDALTYRAARDLNQLASEIGEPAPVPAAWLSEFGEAFEEMHWDPELELYVDFDCVAGSRIRRPTPAGLAVLWAGLGEPGRRRRAWRRYRELAGDALPVPTVPPSDPAFDPDRSWRGPVWVNVNWLLAEGLAEDGLRREASELREQTLSLVAGGGFAEFFEPAQGLPRGARSFSWTAALTLDLLQKDRKPAG